MKTAAVPATSAADAGAEALIREARRRQRRRRAAIGLALVILAAGATGIFAGRPGARQPPAGPPRAGARPARDRGPRRPAPGQGRPRAGAIPASAGSTVLMWPVGPAQAGGVFLDNLRTRQLRLDPALSVDPGEYQPVQPVGRFVVYVVTAGVSAAAAEGSSRPRVLGKTLYFAPAAAPGRIWLEYPPSRLPGQEKARSVSVATGAKGPVTDLPPAAGLIAGTDAGLLLSARHHLQLWTPGGTPRTLPDSRSAQVFGVSGRRVAYDTGCRSVAAAPGLPRYGGVNYDACAMLRVLNVVTGGLRSFPAPARTGGWVPNHGGFVSVSAIAAGGSRLAAETVIGPYRQGRVRVYILSLRGARRRPSAVPSSDASLFTPTAWSASGAWLFFQGPGQHLWAYQPATAALRSSAAPCCQYTVMASVGG